MVGDKIVKSMYLQIVHLCFYKIRIDLLLAFSFAIQGDRHDQTP